MASFFNDICKISYQDTETLQGKYEEELTKTLCDVSASVKDWEIAAQSFLDLKADVGFFYDPINFEQYLNDAFGNLRKDLSDRVKELQSLDISGLSLEPSSNGQLLYALTMIANITHSMGGLRYALICVMVIKAHYQARRLREISKLVQKDIHKVKAEQFSDLIRTTDEIDQALLSVQSFNDRVPECIEIVLHDSIYETAQRCAILPSRLHMQEAMTTPKTLVNGGGFADIYKSILRDGRVIALKVPRCFGIGKPDEIKKVHAEISKEGVVWHYSSHKNVLPLLGISCIKFLDETPDLLVLVTPWMANGTLKAFLRSNPNERRLYLIRDLTEGVKYLHRFRAPPVVHGDLRCDNILVDENRVAKIADFGLSRVKDFQGSLTGTSSSGAKGSLRWQAPELLFPDRFGGTGKHTSASDIYALGMTCLEIVTDEVPYSGASDAQVISAVLNGDLPTVSEEAVERHLSKRQWERVKQCWSRKVEDRPSAHELRSEL